MSELYTPSFQSTAIILLKVVNFRKQIPEVQTNCKIFHKRLIGKAVGAKKISLLPEWVIDVSLLVSLNVPQEVPSDNDNT